VNTVYHIDVDAGWPQQTCDDLDMAEPLSRQAVIEATRQLIIEDGLDAVSLRRVGAKLEVTAPALYAYVSDKRDLLRAIADEEFAALIDRFEQVTTRDPVERTRAYCRAYVDHARDNPELFKTMFLFQPDLGLGDTPDSTTPSATRAFLLPAEAVTEAVESGTFRAVDPLLASLTMWVAMHGVTDVMLMGFNLDDEFVDRLADTAIDTAIRGLLA
jgi:AcrR family transcriptional regulator